MYSGKPDCLVSTSNLAVIRNSAETAISSNGFQQGMSKTAYRRAEIGPFIMRTQLPKTDDNSRPKGCVSAGTITHDLSSQRLKYYYYRVMEVLIPGVKNI